MKLTVVTGWWGDKAFERYGRRFLQSFYRYWPQEVDLIVYSDEPCPMERGKWRRLWMIPGCNEFGARHKGDPTKGEAAGWKHDALKWFRQGFIPYHAAQGLEGCLLWLDADTVAFKAVTMDWLEQFLPDGKAVSYIGRGKKHSEIGWQMYRLPDAMPMLREFSAIYSTDEVFKLREWHSAYVFDEAMLRTMKPEQCHNLTPSGKGHAWHQCALGERLDHRKGSRKTMGYSPECKTRYW